MKTLFLIDASSYLYRAFHIAPELTNPEGIPIGAVYLYTKMLLRLLQTLKPEFGVVAYDSPGTTLRKQKYPAYKGNRKRNPYIIPQFNLARDATRAMGFCNVEAAGYEADDVIATLTQKAMDAGMAVVICSPDKDLHQLVDDGARVSVFDPLKEVKITASEVREKWGVWPNRVCDLLALTGDVSDNIPGVPGIGAKTAAALINEHGNLRKVLDNTHMIVSESRRASIHANTHLALLSYDLVTLYYDAPIHLELSDMGVLFNRDQVRDFCMLHDFKSLMGKF